MVLLAGWTTMGGRTFKKKEFSRSALKRSGMTWNEYSSEIRRQGIGEFKKQSSLGKILGLKSF